MWEGGNCSIYFTINKVFIQVVDKIKDELQVQTTCWILGYAIVKVHNYKKYKMHHMVQTK
jgi:hypothetical protein